MSQTWLSDWTAAIALLSNSLFRCVDICLVYLGASILGAYICIYIYKLLYLLGELITLSLYNDLLCLSLEFLRKSFLSGIIIATPASLWFLFVWNILFYVFNFSICVSLKLKWFSYRQYKVRSYFFSPFSHSAFCLENVIYFYLK